MSSLVKLSTNTNINFPRSLERTHKVMQLQANVVAQIAEDRMHGAVLSSGIPAETNPLVQAHPFLKEVHSKMLRMSESNKTSLTECITLLFPNSKPDKSYVVFDTLSRIPENKRINFVKRMKLFIESEKLDMEDGIDSILQTLSIRRMTVDQLEVAMSQAKLLFSDSMSGEQKLTIFEDFQRVHESERSSFLLDVQKLLKHPMTDTMRVTLINQMVPLLSQERAKFIKDSLASLHIQTDYLHAVVKNQEAQVPETNPKELSLDKILANESAIVLPQLPDDLHPKHKEMLIKALKIKSHYNKFGYICFLHGQEPTRLILQLLFKEIAKIRNPEQQLKESFVHLRPEQFSQQAPTIQLAEELKKIIYHDNEQRELVMSVDAHFLNTTRSESANYWCKKARSVAPIASTGLIDFAPLLGNLPHGAITVIKREIDTLNAIIAQNVPCGNLYIICIPKEKVMDYSYPAVPGGQFCDCRSKSETMQQLIDANKDKRPLCKNGSTTQWRLVAAALKPENGVRSFVLSPHEELTHFTEEYIKPLAAKIVYLQNKCPKSNL